MLKKCNQKIEQITHDSYSDGDGSVEKRNDQLDDNLFDDDNLDAIH